MYEYKNNVKSEFRRKTRKQAFHGRRGLAGLKCLLLLRLVVWLSGNELVSINEVTLRRARVVLGWVTVSGVQLPVRENLCQYITSHPGQLSLAIPLWIGAVSSSQRAVMLCSWGVKADMVREWVAGKTV